jgi:hydrogenase maturation protease
MKVRRRPGLVLALGNDLLGDDGVGLAAARALRPEFSERVDIVETSEAGLALLEWLEGYKRALLLDSIMTGRHRPGTALEFSPDDFRAVSAPSPHYAGLPEAFCLAQQLGILFPEKIRILAMEIENSLVIREGLSQSVSQALPGFVERARRILSGWESEDGAENGKNGMDAS